LLRAFEANASVSILLHGAGAHARLSFAAAWPASLPAIDPNATAAFERVLGYALFTICSARRAPSLTYPFLLCVLQEVSFYGDGQVLQTVILFERHLLMGTLCSRTPCSSRQ
jgi:hypothetical protein